MPARKIPNSDGYVTGLASSAPHGRLLVPALLWASRKCPDYVLLIYGRLGYLPILTERRLIGIARRRMFKQFNQWIDNGQADLRRKYQQDNGG